MKISQINTSSVTEAQINACTRVIDEATNTVFYQVDSSQNDGTFYTVRKMADKPFLTCSCPAGQAGQMCWHRRAALAHAKEYKALKAAEQQAQTQQDTPQVAPLNQWTPTERREYTRINQSRERGRIAILEAIALARSNY